MVSNHPRGVALLLRTTAVLCWLSSRVWQSCRVSQHAAFLGFEADEARKRQRSTQDECAVMGEDTMPSASTGHPASGLFYHYLVALYT